LNGLYFGSQLMENKYELIMIENETWINHDGNVFNSSYGLFVLIFDEKLNMIIMKHVYSVYWVVPASLGKINDMGVRVFPHIDHIKIDARTRGNKTYICPRVHATLSNFLFVSFLFSHDATWVIETLCIYMHLQSTNRLDTRLIATLLEHQLQCHRTKH
jgi:hypothetical protein